MSQILVKTWRRALHDIPPMRNEHSQPLRKEGRLGILTTVQPPPKALISNTLARL